MKLQFDSNQNYQLQAVQSVVNIFEGQPLAKDDVDIVFTNDSATNYNETKGVGNNLVLSNKQILKNINHIQAQNAIPLSKQLETSLANNEHTKMVELNFTIEMETGTGKTYTFLRTIYELNKTYNFKKFVIVVPSIAIREGTMKNLQITHQHFQYLYNNTPISYTLYDRDNVAALRNFATSNTLQILIINIDSFAKDNNVINTLSEKGLKPIEHIQITQPIVIIDEPQNFETDVRLQAIANLNPLCTLRYSATHRNLYNLVYSLNPVQAYDLGLVKQIEVDGITADANHNAAFIKFRGVQLGKKTLKAKLCIYTNHKGNIELQNITANIGDDLFALSNGRDVYKDGFILNNINAAQRTITFLNGTILQEGETQGGLNDEIMKFQVEQTVKWHFEKVKKLESKGIKVLSLFFIDRVANYRWYDADGNAQKGKFALWFEAAYNELKKQYPNSIPFEAEQTHNGYFSSDRAVKGKSKQEIWVDSKEKNTQKDNDTYSLIMKDKERLLDTNEPLQFIFSHSALREGWDNPNVFQICTLNESKSEVKKRQEIGRGLRLPVNNMGQRIHDKQINVLTIIANQAYEDFSKALQNEIQEETSVDFSDRIKNARNKVQIKRNKELNAANFPLLFEIWEQISHKTSYSVAYSTQKLIEKAVEDIKKMPLTQSPILKRKTGSLTYGNKGIYNKLIDDSQKHTTTQISYQIPDVYNYIQQKIDITRDAIYQILIQSDRYEELAINPQIFLDNVITCIRRVLNVLLVDGVKYQTINGQRYPTTLFDAEEIENYLSKLFKVTNTDKTVFNYVPIDGSNDSDFAKDCEADPNIKFFFRLPKEFKIPTPLGNYVPQWAVMLEKEGKQRVYFVIETQSELPTKGTEQMKIACAQKHFASFNASNVAYKVAAKTTDLY